MTQPKSRATEAPAAQPPCQCNNTGMVISPTHPGHCCYWPPTQTCHQAEVAAWQAKYRPPSAAAEEIGAALCRDGIHEADTDCCPERSAQHGPDTPTATAGLQPEDRAYAAITAALTADIHLTAKAVEQLGDQTLNRLRNVAQVLADATNTEILRRNAAA